MSLNDGNDSRAVLARASPLRFPLKVISSRDFRKVSTVDYAVAHTCTHHEGWSKVS
jgi:hypothetical protein